MGFVLMVAGYVEPWWWFLVFGSSAFIMDMILTVIIDEFKKKRNV